jgi:hypothetical protein
MIMNSPSAERLNHLLTAKEKNARAASQVPSRQLRPTKARRSVSLPEITAGRVLIGLAVGTTALFGALNTVRVETGKHHYTNAAITPPTPAEINAHNPNVHLAHETIKASGMNSLSQVVDKYGSHNDPLNGANMLDQYMGKQPGDYTVHPGDVVEFYYNSETRKIVPKDQAPPIPTSAEAK